MPERRQAVVGSNYPDDRRTGDDRRRRDPDVVGNRLIIDINLASEGGNDPFDPFPVTRTPIDITPFVAVAVIIVAIGVVILEKYVGG